MSHLKAAIGLAVASESTVPAGPLQLELAFAVGEYAPSRVRNWVSLWKPTIDALGRVLGDDARAVQPER